MHLKPGKSYGLGGGVNHTNMLFSQRDDIAADNHSVILLLTEASNLAPYTKAGIRSSNGIFQPLSYPKMDYNEWHHYAMTVNSNDFIFYIDGVEVNRTSNNQAGDYKDFHFNSLRLHLLFFNTFQQINITRRV